MVASRTRSASAAGVALVGLIVLASSLAACRHGDVREQEAIPAPHREFRAAWVATVANIDWPSAPALPVEQQKREAVAILDRLVELNMNAVVFQVRPHGDALYESAFEPWSSYLTGKQGRPPEPFYDPLAFWVEQAHARGLQLHAWFNPYRANHPANRGGMSETSLVKARPDLVVKLGDEGYWWMDPSLEEVQDHCVTVVMDVVRRYDVDGIHFDDYFYPYPSYNGGRDFPDDRSWALYRESGGKLSRSDWRREAVNRLIARLYREIKAEKAHVEFGLSPFGIWRPGHPRSIQGLDQHEVLFADARRWLNEGWVDYLTPQLYWPIARIPQSFPVLLGWWKDENRVGRHLWPGTSVARAKGEAGATEIANQIMITRGMLPGSPGLCMFSMKWLQVPDAPVPAQLVKGPYARPALIPSSPWLDDEAPLAPRVKVRADGDAQSVSWAPRGEEPAFQWILYVRRGGTWSHEIHPAGTRSVTLRHGDRTIESIAVSAVDRSRNESTRALADSPLK